MILQFLQVPYPRYNFHSFMCTCVYLCVPDVYTHTHMPLLFREVQGYRYTCVVTGHTPGVYNDSHAQYCIHMYRVHTCVRTHLYTSTHTTDECNQGPSLTIKPLSHLSQFSHPFFSSTFCIVVIFLSSGTI